MNTWQNVQSTYLGNYLQIGWRLPRVKTIRFILEIYKSVHSGESHGFDIGILPWWRLEKPCYSGQGHY